jgi:DNA polymerase I-like protein with 3'-5' exonuclease and polymerase domains
VRYYTNNANADFHQMVAEMAGIDRWSAKIINLGMMYGMGGAKLSRSLRLSLEDGREMLELYHSRVPWVKGLTDYCASAAQRRGWIKMLDGARARFDRWQPCWDKSGVALPRNAALERWPDKKLERAGTHKAMNRLCQGGAARQTKLAMAACWSEGYVPLVQLHDELDFSFAREQDGARCAEIMRDVVQLQIPINVDAEFGRDWGHAKYSWQAALAA